MNLFIKQKQTYRQRKQTREDSTGGGEINEEFCGGCCSATKLYLILL